MNVLIVYDYEYWILGKIASRIALNYKDHERIRIETVQIPGSPLDLVELQKSYDVIHFLSPSLYFSHQHLIHIPVVVTVHHIGSRVREWLENYSEGIDVMASTNQQCISMLSEIEPAGNPLVVPTFYGLDTDQFSPENNQECREVIRSRFGIEKDRLVLGLSAKPGSNEDSRKGFDRYWDLLRRLKKLGIKTKLLVFGPLDEEKNGWKSEGTPDDIKDMISFTGFVHDDDLAEYYRGLDFYVCLSRLEGGPYPVMECMACGTLVISTEVGVVGNLIKDDETGFLVDGDNFLEKISDILKSYTEDSGTMASIRVAARERVEKVHSWENVFRKTDYPAMYLKAVEQWITRASSKRIIRKLNVQLNVFKYKIRSLLNRK